MILFEGLSFFGFVFIFTIPVYSIYSLIKYIKRKTENREAERVLSEARKCRVESDKLILSCSQELAEIRRLDKAIDDCSDPDERKHLRAQLYSLLESN